MTTTTQRQDYVQAAAAHDAAQRTYSDLYMQLQVARSNFDNVTALDLQGQLARASEKVVLAKQLLDGHALRVRNAEHRALERIKRLQVANYADLAHQLAAQLALLMSIDLKIGQQFDSAGLGGFRVPGYGALKTDDTGAIVAFGHLNAMLPAAAARVEEMLNATQEESHGH